MEQKTEKYDRIYEYLLRKYKRITIGKKEMAAELGIGLSTLDKYIAQGMGIPPYKKIGRAKNARLLFCICDVAEFLNRDQIKTM